MFSPKRLIIGTVFLHQTILTTLNATNWNTEGSNLYKFKDSKRWSAVVPEQEPHNADELSVEATITQTQQETAYQRHRHTDNTWTIQQINAKC